MNQKCPKMSEFQQSTKFVQEQNGVQRNREVITHSMEKILFEKNHKQIEIVVVETI